MVQRTQSLYTRPAADLQIPDSGEVKKVNYWLEKLYSQGKNKASESSVSSVNTSVGASSKELQEEGRNEQKINEATKKEEDKQTVNDLVKKSNRCIISISSLFPWTFFPNTIQVEESRVTFIFRQFLASQSHSVNIKDISNVFIESSPYFSTLQVVSRTFVQNDIKIGHLNTGKAIKVRMIIEGLRTFAEHNIDTSNYEISELLLKSGNFIQTRQYHKIFSLLT